MNDFFLCNDFINVMPEHKYAKDFVGMMGSVYFKRKTVMVFWKNCWF